MSIKLFLTALFTSLFILTGCDNHKPDDSTNYLTTHAIIVTSEAGDKLTHKENVVFKENISQTGNIIAVKPDIIKQTMHGVGTSFTESSAFVLAHLDSEKRKEVMTNIYGKDGANFPFARTHIGATDFSVKGKYSYADIPDDKTLEHFTIQHDQVGFSSEEYPTVKDNAYDLLPMIKEANAIKLAQSDVPIKIIASAWTAPAWMKDIEDWYQRGTEETNFEGTGGSLKPEFIQLYANYLVKYLDAYQAEGIDIWGLTPVNEPHGNSGQWESMHFTPESQNTFIKNNLGPTLRASDHGDIKLLIYDQNRDHIMEWADAILADPETSQYVYGTAVHWYASTNKVFEEDLEAVHNKYPDFEIIHTEGTIDDLGKPAPNGIGDPEGFEEKDWFNNDTFWWNANATDWAYTASWAPNPEAHPMYTPVHRYARNIIVSFNHWMTGWVDWNVVLDHNGGPNHVGNFCGAPIMIDTTTGDVYYTPIYYVLAQFSRTIRPGDRAVQVNARTDNLGPDAIHASATINDKGLLSVQVLNTTKSAVDYKLVIGKQTAFVSIPANAVQTVQVQL